MAALLIDLVADPREIYLEPKVTFPLIPAARALGVPPETVLTVLHQLAGTHLLDFTEIQADDGLWVAVELWPPCRAVEDGQELRPAPVPAWLPQWSGNGAGHLSG